MDIQRDTTGQTPRPLTPTGVSVINLRNKQLLVEIHKRTERLSAALFLITDILSDMNPIRQRIRVLSVEMMSFMLNSATLISEDSRLFTDRFERFLLEISSLLEIASLSEQLSEMNFKLISLEIERIIESAQRLRKGSQYPSVSSRTSHLLEDVGATVRTPLTASDQFKKLLYRVSSHKGHSIRQNKGRMSYSTKTVQGQSNSFVKDTNRKDMIVSTLKNGKHLTVRDFMSVIYGVSEKTIQRELVSLVQDGVLKREGKRRWSRYYLSVQSP